MIALAILAIAWAISGVVIGRQTTDFVYVSRGLWLLVLIWMAMGPFAAWAPGARS